MMAMTMPTSAVVGMASFVVGALVVGALVGESGPEHVTPFGGAHTPVLRHAGHIAPSVHDGLRPMTQPWRFPTMLQMPDSAPVSWLPFKYLRSAP